MDFVNELDSGIQELKGVISEYKQTENVEIELRIGRIEGDKFNSGLKSESFFNQIKERLDSNPNWDKVLKIKTTELNNQGVRKITHFNDKKMAKSSCIKKSRLKNINLRYNNTPYDIRIGVSKEIDSDIKIRIGTTRIKDRVSYFHKDYRLDLTKVEQTENTVTSINYEFEVEFLNLDNEVSDLYRAHSGLLIMRDIINMCEPITESKLELEQTKTPEELLSDLKI